MKRPLLIISSAVVLVAACAVAIFYAHSAGRIAGQQLASLEAFSAAHASLQSPSLTPQTREHIKAQFYYHGCRIRPEVVRAIPIIDYGRVDEALLVDTEPYVRHADPPNGYYEELLRIHVSR